MISSSLRFFSNCAYREFSSEKHSDTVVIFFHGFPADSGKNEDIAEQISVAFGFSTYIFEYSGLGNSSGDFSLSNSIKESESFIKYIITSKKIQRLVVVGHSWGGLVAINLIEKIPEISEAILLAPLVLLPEEETAKITLLEFISYEKEIRKKQYCIEQLMEEFYFIKRNCSPLQKLTPITKRNMKIAIIQGNADDVCPVSGAIELQQKIGASAKLIRISAGHWFENRIQLMAAVKGILGSKL